MAKSQKRSNREVRKPKAEKPARLMRPIHRPSPVSSVS